MAGIWTNLGLKYDHTNPGLVRPGYKAPSTAMVNSQPPVDMPPMEWPAGSYETFPEAVPKTAGYPPPLVMAPPSQPTQAALNAEALQQVTPGTAGAMKMSGAGEPDDFDKRYTDYLNQLDARGQAAIAGQKQGLTDAERSLGAARAIPMQTNIAPLMALADTWWGGNLSKGYTAPEGLPDRIKLVETLQQGLQKQRAGLSEAEIALMKQRLGGEEALAGMKNQRENAKMRREEMALAREARKDQKTGMEDAIEAERFQKSDMYTDMRVGIKGRELIQRVRDIVQRNGGQIPDMTSPLRAEFESAFTSMQLDQKEQYALGALSGPDFGLIVRATGNPGVMSQEIDKLIDKTRGKSSVLSRLEQIEKDATNRYTRANQLAVTRYKNPTSVGLIGDLSGQWSQASGGQAPAAMDPEKLKWLNENPNDPRAIEIRQREGL